MPADTTQTPFDTFVSPAPKKPAIWRIILGFIVILAAFILGNEAIIYGIARLFPLTTVDDVFAAREPLTLAFLLAAFAPTCLGVWCAARWGHGRSLGSVIGPRHIVLRDFATATATFVAVSTVMFVMWSCLHDTTPNLPLGIFLKWLPLMLVLLFFQTGAEELIYRGDLPQQLRARFQSPLIGICCPLLPSQRCITISRFTAQDHGSYSSQVASAQFYGWISPSASVHLACVGMAFCKQYVGLSDPMRTRRMRALCEKPESSKAV